MKKYWADKWIKALESGEYKQTKGCLRKKLKDDTLGYCCLGVLEDICGTRWVRLEHRPDFAPVHEESNNSSLSNKTRAKTNIRTTSAEYYGDRYKSLVALNDGMSTAEGALPAKRFPAIAKIIKKHWKEL